MAREGETRRIDGEVASEFYHTLNFNGFDPAMRSLSRSLGLDFEQPYVVTLAGEGMIEVDLLTKRLSYNTFRWLLGY